MSDQALDPSEFAAERKPTNTTASLTQVLWTVAQPMLVLGSIFLVATMVLGDWMNHKLDAIFMIMLPIPLLLVAERYWAKRKDWLLKPNELAEDGFWIAFSAFLWGPLISDAYSTPISEGFRAIRDRSMLDITMAPETILGLVCAAIFLRVCSSFIYYWLHRVQHESLFFAHTCTASSHHQDELYARRANSSH